MHKPLEGLRILDLSWVAQGPCATKWLGDSGATVVKIESIKSYDVHRAYAPYAGGVPGVNRGGSFTEFNSSKYGMALDMSHPRSGEVFKKLIAWADVLLETMRPGVMEEWGYGYENVKKINPEIIMVRGSAYGQRGPYSSLPGFGTLAQAASGITGLVGWPDRAPAGPGVVYSDPPTACLVAIAILAASDYRRRTGKGAFIDVGQLLFVPSLLAPSILDYSLNKRIPQALGNRHQVAAPHGAFRCKGDDRWCTIAIFSDAEWKALCQAMGNPSWTGSQKFATNKGRKENEDELEKLIESWTIGYTSEEVMERLQKVKVGAGIVREAWDLLEQDPQLKHRDYFHYLDHPEIGLHANKSAPFILSESSRQPQMRTPCLGEHTEYICREMLGMSDEEFTELFNEGVFR